MKDDSNYGTIKAWARLCNQYNGKEVDKWQTTIPYLQGMDSSNRRK